MQNETKAALAVGLVIIVGFGLVLIEVKGAPSAGAPPSTETGGGEFTSHALVPVVDDVRPEDHRREVAPAPPPRLAPRSRRRALTRRGDPAPRPAPRPVQRPVARRSRSRAYTVQPNDSLSRIARRVYGSNDPKYYKLIYEANRDKLPDIATVRTGQVLVIPAPPDGLPVRSARLDAGRRHSSMAMRDGARR